MPPLVQQLLKRIERQAKLGVVTHWTHTVGPGEGNRKGSTNSAFDQDRLLL